MKITYDPSVDAMYIKFNDMLVAQTEAVNDDIIIDSSKSGVPIGFEILNPRHKRMFRSLSSVELMVYPQTPILPAV